MNNNAYLRLPAWLPGIAARLERKNLVVRNISPEMYLQPKRAWGLPERVLTAALMLGGETLKLVTTTGKVLTMPLKLALEQGRHYGYFSPEAPLFVEERLFTQRAGERRKAA